MELSTINTTMSSREIAELTGKQHKNVLRDCDSLNENYEKLGMLKIEQGYFTLPKTGNQQHRCFNLSKIQTMDLLTGYSIPLRIKVNRRWEELENEKNNPLLSNTAIIALTNQLKKDRDSLSEEIARLEAKAESLEVIKDYILKAITKSSLITNQPQQLDESWESIFIENYGESTKDFIDRYFHEWLERKEIPVKEFNDTYKFKQLPLRVFLQAIFQYSARNKVHFTRNKVVKKEGGSLRVRMFNRK